MSRLPLVTIPFAVLLGAGGTCCPRPQPGSPEALSHRISDAAGGEAWDDLAELRFTWTHHPSGKRRSYVWRIPERRVAVTRDGETIEVHLGAVGDDDATVAAHRAFVNDSYWLCFDFFQHRDRVAYGREAVDAVPGHPELPAVAALSVRYPEDGGYTPGDRYVCYVDAADRAFAWAFHPGGAEEAKIVTTRERWRVVAGVRFPTAFVRRDGTRFITVDDLAATRR